jgi:AcrR family transcriptional regulator
MEVIAAAAGVTKPIVYKHFGDREGLARALSEEFVAGLVDELTGVLHRDAQPRDLLRTTIDAYLGFVERDPHVYRFQVHQARGGADMGSTLTPVIVRLGLEIGSVLRAQLLLAGLEADAAEPWAFGIIGMVRLAGDWWLERGDLSRSELVDFLTDLLWEGLSGAPTTLPARETAPSASAGDE